VTRLFPRQIENKNFSLFGTIYENRGQIEPFRGQRINSKNRGQSSEKPS